MRAFFANKIWIVFASVIALFALTALAAGLGNVSFREGQAFGRKEAEVSISPPIDIVQTASEIPAQTMLTVLSLMVMAFLLISLLISPEARKQLIRFVIRAGLTILALYILLTRYPNTLSQFRINRLPFGDAGLPETASAPVPIFTPPQSVSSVAYLVSFAIAGLTVFVLWRISVAWREANPVDSESSKKRIARIARSSLADLSSGRESTDVIMNCYYRMSDAVSARRNLKRGASVTPGEFASRLETAGLPSDSVRTLTRLFESVRYGGHRSDSQMVNEAVACLTSILQFCGETV